MEVISAASEPESSDTEYETVTMASEPVPDPDKYDKEMDLDEEKKTLDKLKASKFLSSTVVQYMYK